MNELDKQLDYKIDRFIFTGMWLLVAGFYVLVLSVEPLLYPLAPILIYVAVKIWDKYYAPR